MPTIIGVHRRLSGVINGPMNYLAHIHLSGDDIQVALGNFMGDGVKGRDLSRFPKAIRTGLMLHRAIDHHADTHSSNQGIRDHLRPHFGRWSGIVADMYHDHFLAKEWTRYHDADLETFLHDFYKDCEPYLEWMPRSEFRFFEASRKGLWMKNYAQIDGMRRSFEGMRQRIPRAEVFAGAADFLEMETDSLQSFFESYYPHLMQFAKDKKEELNIKMTSD